LSKSVEGGFFDVEFDSLDIPVDVPTKVWSKCMMRCKGKETLEERGSPTKVIRKRALVKGKEIQKMLQWIQMGSKE
jgi:hypothetical protein